MSSDGVGGISAAGNLVFVGGRDIEDRRDRFVAVDRSSGKQVWVYQYDAVAELDYGNSPRATPLFTDGVLVTLGATGVLSALDAESGIPLWTVNLPETFAAEVPTWGFSGSPIVIDAMIYLQINRQAALVAIDLFSGETKYAVPGHEPSYSSLIETPDHKFLLGVDSQGYFARRVNDGALVWSLKPQYDGDFGVPSPVIHRNGLILASENNGIQFVPRSIEQFGVQVSMLDDSLIPDSHTPVVMGDEVLVAHDGLHSLDVKNQLNRKWSVAESKITGYASIIASSNRAIVTTESGDWILVDTGKGRVIEERSIIGSRKRVLSHPAICENQLFQRVGDQLFRFDLDADGS